MCTGFILVTQTADLFAHTVTFSSGNNLSALHSGSAGIDCLAVGKKQNSFKFNGAAGLNIKAVNINDLAFSNFILFAT